MTKRPNVARNVYNGGDGKTRNVMIIVEELRNVVDKPSTIEEWKLWEAFERKRQEALHAKTANQMLNIMGLSGLQMMRE